MTIPRSESDREKRKREEAFADLLANIAVAVICGLVSSALFVCGAMQYHYPGTLLIAVAVVGFVIGSAYGLWHAISGWKRNDSQMVDDDEFRFFE